MYSIIMNTKTLSFSERMNNSPIDEEQQKKVDLTNERIIKNSNNGKIDFEQSKRLMKWGDNKINIRMKEFQRRIQN